ncbi:MAG TPA: hypothetical protein PLP29_08570 [Candidatus Ozemobacteraceae bacterium]|nr:hypothetical protein [Candidatus Ozemobacteraceae bacterium]
MNKHTLSYITCAFLALPALAAAQGAYNPLAGSGYHTPAPTEAPLPVSQASAPVRPPTAMTASGALAGYDPFMDNHLEAPVTAQGMFGIPVREAEKVFRAYGAKPYSYAFGKHSRLLLSVYLVTIFFDRSRNVGEIQVEPRPPYKIIEPTARGFFLQLITRETRPDEFETVLTPSKISVKYARSGKPPETATSTW